MVLPVRLGNTELQLAGANGVDVVDRATGRFDRATDAVFLARLVYEAADGTTGRIVHARHATGADGNEPLFGCRGSSRHADKGCRGKAVLENFLHDELNAPYFSPK
jgi:hypothetical protein